MRPWFSSNGKFQPFFKFKLNWAYQKCSHGWWMLSQPFECNSRIFYSFLSAAVEFLFHSLPECWFKCFRIEV
jgi:hypothetical protein